MLIDFQECLKKGLLRKTTPSKEQALLSLEKAEMALEDAKANLEEKRYDSCTLIAYAAILNAARSILFNDGYREKSHMCTVRYLEAKHLDKFGMETIKLFDGYRETRHEVQYSPAFRADKRQAESIVKFAENFLEQAEGIIK